MGLEGREGGGGAYTRVGGSGVERLGGQVRSSAVGCCSLL